ncbi:MAG: carbohydrate kinase family protein [Euryarchaeota archaeon]|jgi:ribokinase|nr:carbohydrate kinase family protein [Euryarchaeota archaeon]
MILDVIGFGALNLDRIYHVNRIAGADEESYIIKVSESCGGSAANTIIGLSRLGLETGFLGKVAADGEGKILLKNLEREGVDTSSLIIAQEGRSGVVHGFVDKKGDRALYVDPGVNDELLVKELDYAYAANCNLLHLSSFVGDSIKAQESVLERIPDDVTVSMDPGMLYAHQGLKKLGKLLNCTDILLINQQELDVLLAGQDFEDQVETLFDYDLKILAVKKGSEGCFVSDGEEHHQIYAFEVPCLDTTGAGDAFNSGFLYGILQGYALKDAGVLGNYVASCSIQEYGACRGLPYQEDVPHLREPE